MCLRSRWLQALLFFAIVLLVGASEADACWWRHCRCHHGGGASFSPAGAPAAAPGGIAAAPVQYTYVQPSLAFVQPAAAPQQGLVSNISTIREILELAREFREAFRGGGGLGGGDLGGGDTSSLEAALQSLKDDHARLLAGQEDLRGRAINNAGIGQSLGEQLIKMTSTIDNIDANTNSTSAGTDLAAQVASMNERLEKIEERTKEGGDLEAMISRKNEDLMKKLIEELDKRYQRIPEPPAGGQPDAPVLPPPE